MSYLKLNNRGYLLLTILYLFFLLLLTSCAVSQHRYKEGDNSSQKTIITVKDEIMMAREVLPRMRKDYPPVKDSRLQAYVQQLGRKLVIENDLEGNPYHYNFSVVNVSYVNAFALPAGTIFVTAPLIKMAENEAELAGVIGHEIGHVIARHTAERIDKAKKDKTKNLFYTVGSGILGGAAGYGAGKILCPDGDKECLAKASIVGAAVGAGGALLVQKYKFMANSREDKMEADRIGFRVATGAGYSKDQVGKFYEKLYQMEGKHRGKQSELAKSIQDAFTTHPPSIERVNQMHEMASRMLPQANPLVNSKEFDRAKKYAARVKPVKPVKQNK